MISLKEKFLSKENLRNFLSLYQKPALSFLFALILSRAKTGSSFYPFAAAALSSSPFYLMPFSLLGGITGTFFFLLGRNSLRYLASLLLGAALRYTFSFFRKGSDKAVFLCSFISLFSTALPFVLKDWSLSILLIYLGEALAASISSVLFKKAGESLSSPFISSGEALSVSVTFSILYMALLDFKIFEIAPVRILSSAFIFSASMHLPFGCPLYLSSLLAITSFLKGDTAASLIFITEAFFFLAFLPAGKALSFASAFLSSCFFLALKGIDQSFLIYLSEISGAMIISLFIPKAIYGRLLNLKNSKNGEYLKNASAYRLLKTSKALQEIGAVTERVSKEVEKLNSEPMEVHIARAVSKACRKCKKSPECYQRCYERTMEEVRRLFIDGKNGLSLDMDAFLEKVPCIKSSKIEEAIKEESRLYADFLKSKSHSQSLRYIMCDQFSGMSRLLYTLNEEVASLSPLEGEEEKAVSEVLDMAGKLNEGCFFGRDKNGIIVISALFGNSLKESDLPSLTSCLEEALHLLLSPPCKEEESGKTRLTWREKPVFNYQYDYIQRASCERKLCGDSVDTATDLSGNPVFIISDGMGVGGDAAVDSTMTASLLSRLISSGASFPEALKLVSSSLLSLKDERLCTVDLLMADLHKGSLTFYKAGSAPSYLLRGGRCFKIGKSALPAGILGGAEAAKSEFKLQTGDLVLMASDGVTETGEDWILSSLPPLKDLEPKDICEEIADMAISRNLTDRHDDISCMVIKFE